MNHCITLPTPVGTLALSGDDAALSHLELPGPARRAVATTVLGAADVPEPLRDTARQLEEYFAGRRRHFDLPLHLAGTDFQCAVWRSLAEIPYGETVSYGEVAAMVGRPRAFRAVGQANGANPIPIVLPCHRVVASGGGIGGYGGGLALKRALLAIEGVTAA